MGGERKRERERERVRETFSLSLFDTITTLQ